MNRNSLTILVGTIFSMACATILLAAGYDDCQMAIRQQVQSNNRQVEKILFDAASDTHEDVSQSVTIYRGNGEFIRHTGKHEYFVWECSFNPPRGTINDAHYSVITDTHPPAGAPVYALKDLVGVDYVKGQQVATNRGYKFLKTQTRDGAYSYWREIKTGYCVIIHTENGRYQSIGYAAPGDCN